MSTKTSNQPGRRTPLSLSGGVTKGGQSNTNNKGGNANGHHANNHKQDNKNQQHNKTESQQQQHQLQTNNQKPVQAVDTKENPSKNQNKQAATDSKIPKPQSHQNSDNSKTQKQQNDKKQAAVAEKQQQQNGVANSNNKTSGNQQPQQQQQQQNGNDVKLVEKDKKAAAATQEKPAKEEKEKNKSQDKPGKAEKDANKTQDKPAEKVDKEKNETQEKHDDKKCKEDKKVQDSKKDSKNAKEDKKDTVDKKEEKSENANEKPNTTENDTKQEHSIDQQAVEQMDVVEEPKEAQSQQEQQKQENQKSAPSTPKSLRDSKSQTPNKATPTKAEKSAQKSTPPTKREVTTAIDDVEMEPLAMDPPSPIKEQAREKHGLAPCATSTPGKALLPKPTTAKTDVQLAMQASVTPERPRVFSQISGRRAIRPITDYTPSKFQSNPQFRESYRRINTELDATNTSLNVTVGSEVPNNASFSFFGRGRKRDRTPPQHSQSAIGELPTEMEISPPKRARLDFFSVVSSPLSLLRNRFSKATLQSSTPVKLQQKLEEKEDDIEVQNVSGVSVHEDIDKSADESAAEGETSYGEEVTANKTPVEGELEIGDNGAKELPLKSAAEKQISEDGDIKITETPLLPAEGDPVAKNKRCVVM